MASQSNQLESMMERSNILNFIEISAQKTQFSLVLPNKRASTWFCWKVITDRNPTELSYHINSFSLDTSSSSLSLYPSARACKRLQEVTSTYYYLP
eukprot:scaffold27465_cov59-Cyclotella_meneghiniana.AAC.2